MVMMMRSLGWMEIDIGSMLQVGLKSKSGSQQRCSNTGIRQIHYHYFPEWRRKQVWLDSCVDTHKMPLGMGENKVLMGPSFQGLLFCFSYLGRIPY